jgi:hypothetical protein
MKDVMLSEVQKLHKLYSRLKKKRGAEFKNLIENSRNINKYCVYGVMEKDIPELFSSLGMGEKQIKLFLSSPRAECFNPSEIGERVYLPSSIAKFVNGHYVTRKYGNKPKTTTI